MEILALLKLIPYVLTSVEVAKRFVPKEVNPVVNPIVAGISGLIAAYTTGGIEGVIPMIIYGLLAGIGAMATYSAPKALGKKLLNK